MQTETIDAISEIEKTALGRGIRSVVGQRKCLILSQRAISLLQIPSPHMAFSSR